MTPSMLRIRHRANELARIAFAVAIAGVLPGGPAAQERLDTAAGRWDAGMGVDVQASADSGTVWESDFPGSGDASALSVNAGVPAPADFGTVWESGFPGSDDGSALPGNVTVAQLVKVGTAAGGTSASGSPSATVAVRAGHYAMAGRGYDDLDQLEAVVRATRPESVQIAWCDDGSARAWLGVVARFGELPLRFDAAPGVCGAVPLRVSARAGSLPQGIDDAAVADYWNRRMP